MTHFYGFSFEDSEGSFYEASGQQTGPWDQVIRGSYGFTAPNGRKYTINYVADKNGFRPVGRHIPRNPQRGRH